MPNLSKDAVCVGVTFRPRRYCFGRGRGVSLQQSTCVRQSFVNYFTKSKKVISIDGATRRQKVKKSLPIFHFHSVLALPLFVLSPPWAHQRLSPASPRAAAAAAAEAEEVTMAVDATREPSAAMEEGDAGGQGGGARGRQDLGGDQGGRRAYVKQAARMDVREERGTMDPNS